MSDPYGVELPPLTAGERAPLRSLQNVMQQGHSTPSSKRQSRSLASSDVLKTTKDEPNQPTEEKCNMSLNLVDNVSLLNTSTACCGEITLKSFTCAGGEIEVLDHSNVAEDSIVLTTDQPANTLLQEDVSISDSVIVHVSGSDHMDHAYCDPKGVDDVAVNPPVPPNEHSTPIPILASTNTDAQREPTLVTGCRDAECHVVYKSFICDGGEVEVLDASARLLSETIPLPGEELADQCSDYSVSMSVVGEDCGDRDQQDHADHPYSSNGRRLSSSVEQNCKLTDGPADITLKSFLCTGGEVELSDATMVTMTDQTIPLPSAHLDVGGYLANDKSVMNQSTFTDTEIMEPRDGHLEHCYFNAELLISPSPSGDLSAPQEPLPSSAQAPQLEECASVTDGGNADGAFHSLGGTVGRVSPTDTPDILLLEKAVSLLDHPAQGHPPSHNDSRAVDDVVASPPQESQHPCALKNDESVEPAPAIESATADASGPVADIQDASQADLPPAEASAVAGAFQPVDGPGGAACESSARPHSPVTMPLDGQTASDSGVHLRSGPLASGGAQKDSALGTSGDAPRSPGWVDDAPAEEPADTLGELQAFPAVANTLQFDLLSPVVRGMPLARIRTYKDSPLAKYLAEDSLAETPAGPRKGPLRELLESPMPRPLFNSTALCTRYSGEQPAVAVPGEEPEQKPRARRSVVMAAPVPVCHQKPCGLPDLPLVPNGPLQQQLCQMAELLMLASQKMCAAAGDAVDAAGAAGPAPSPPAESHSVCVGTSPVKWVDRSLNTSGAFERKREFSVADGCTSTDPLLWNLPPGSLESLPKWELEQRLRSSMIMVEALVQQLDVARGQHSPSGGPPPSQLRDTLVQTDHTELSQTSTYRDLYVTALGRIQELEMDQSSLQSLIQAVQETRITAGALSADTDSAISAMKQMERAVREERCSIQTQYGEMKTLCGKFKDSQARMVQRVRDALQQREDMRTQRDEALSSKEAAFSVTEQLRVHCAQQISEMEKSVGCHQELMEALRKTYPQQVELNQAYAETLSSASDLLSRTKKDHVSLAEELARVRSLLVRTVPMLLKLNEKAAEALRDRNQHLLDRDQALEERQQMQDALQQAHVDLRDADQQIGDLNIQANILNSELGVLRGLLSEGEQERAQLERKVTELSATISSTLASYAFLEQALASENSMLQASRKALEQSDDKVAQLEALLGPSEQRVCELSEALANSEHQLALLQAQAQAQAQQILQLSTTCTELSNVMDLNEFLEVENKMMQGQTAETETLFQTNLQSLRERNIQCEDLKGALSRLQLEKASVEADLQALRSRSSHAQQSLGEQLAQATTTLTVQLHTLKGLTNNLHVALGDQTSGSSVDAVSLATTPGRERGHSFVDSVLMALSAEQQQEVEEEEEEEEEEENEQEPDGLPSPQFEGLLSQTSAFTRITPAVTPKKIQRVQEVVEEVAAAEEKEKEEEEEEEELELGSFGLPELLLELSGTVNELVSSLETLRQCKDAQLEEMHSTICDLQREQQAASSRHRDEVTQLTNQLSRLSGQVERGSLALQQKSQAEKTLMNLCDEVNHAREALQKHKAENLELRRRLQQSQVESRALRNELQNAGATPASTSQLMDQKIQLLQEVERLKQGMAETEQAKAKLLERANRHKMVYETNEQRMESELRMLDNMVETARKTLMSIPDVVRSCEELKKLEDYIS